MILSDYGKGGLAHIATMIERARAARTAACWSIPRATTGTGIAARRCSRPTAASFARSSGAGSDEADLTANARRRCARELELEALLVTRSEEGMSLYTGDGRRRHSGAVAREVYDVSGAGDTVIATLGALLAAGADAADRGAHRQRRPPASSSASSAPRSSHPTSSA